MINFPLSEPAAARLLNVLVTAQRLTEMAGCCTADAVQRHANGWTYTEVVDSLDYLVDRGHLARTGRDCAAVFYPADCIVDDDLPPKD